METDGKVSRLYLIVCTQGHYFLGVIFPVLPALRLLGTLYDLMNLVEWTSVEFSLAFSPGSLLLPTHFLQDEICYQFCKVLLDTAAWLKKCLSALRRARRRWSSVRPQMYVVVVAWLNDEARLAYRLGSKWCN